MIHTWIKNKLKDTICKCIETMGDLKRLLSNQIKDTVNLLACICYKRFTPKLFQASTSHLTLENISEKLVDLFQNFTLDFFWYLVELFVVLEIYVGQASVQHFLSINCKQTMYWHKLRPPINF